jgi:hypothetical protein
MRMGRISLSKDRKYGDYRYDNARDNAWTLGLPKVREVRKVDESHRGSTSILVVLF